jgi:hypothetical protein
MTNPEQEARLAADVLRLLERGYSPEEAEQVLEGTLPWPDEPTALSDPTNVLMTEVTGDAVQARDF